MLLLLLLLLLTMALHLTLTSITAAAENRGRPSEGEVRRSFILKCFYCHTELDKRDATATRFKKTAQHANHVTLVEHHTSHVKQQQRIWTYPGSRIQQVRLE
jgi:hypothetical protein